MALPRLSLILGVTPVERENACPFCTELLAPDLLHICPAGCCYVEGFREQEQLVCPYCEEDFRTSAGHVCLELIALTTPRQ